MNALNQRFPKEAINMLSLEYNKEVEFEVLRREYREEGREEGRQEAREEGIKASAVKMHQKGQDVHFIADMLDKSVDWVQQVLAESGDVNLNP